MPNTNTNDLIVSLNLLFFLICPYCCFHLVWFNPFSSFHAMVFHIPASFFKVLLCRCSHKILQFPTQGWWNDFWNERGLDLTGSPRSGIGSEFCSHCWLQHLLQRLWNLNKLKMVFYGAFSCKKCRQRCRVLFYAEGLKPVPLAPGFIALSTCIEYIWCIYLEISLNLNAAL